MHPVADLASGMLQKQPLWIKVLGISSKSCCISPASAGQLVRRGQAVSSRHLPAACHAYCCYSVLQPAQLPPLGQDGCLLTATLRLFPHDKQAVGPRDALCSSCTMACWCCRCPQCTALLTFLAMRAADTHLWRLQRTGPQSPRRGWRLQSSWRSPSHSCPERQTAAGGDTGLGATGSC